jgi:hypothetical protein
VQKNRETVEEQVNTLLTNVMILTLIVGEVDRNGWQAFQHLNLIWTTITRIVGHLRIICMLMIKWPLMLYVFPGRNFQEELFLGVSE